MPLSTSSEPTRFAGNAITNWDVLNHNPNRPGDYPARVYYVNNITGASTNDGLSWQHPMDQLSTAITAWTAFLAGRTSTDAYVRGIIYLQGTGTAYSAITALPNYCDIIGVGANPRGDGAGIAVVKGASADAAAGSARGLGLYNIQFTTSGAYYAMDVAVLLRSTIENCTFMGSTANSAANISAGFRATSSFAGNTFRHCMFGGTNGTYGADIGFEVSAAVAMNNNLFEYNMFFGTVHGLKIHASANDNGTVIRYNLMHSHVGTTECSTAGLQMGAYSIAYNNCIVGADAITEAAAAQTIANWVVAGGNGIVETETA